MPDNTIADNLQRLIDAKADIADAITEMGGTVTAGDGYEEFPDDIRTIPTGGESSFKANVNVTTEPNATVVATRISYPLKVYATVGASINITDGFTVLTGVGAGENTTVNFLIPLNGTWTITSTNGSAIKTRTLVVDAIQEYEVDLITDICGADWNGTSRKQGELT